VFERVGGVSRSGGVETGGLPRELAPLFWEHDFARLSWEEDRDLITGRILAQGDWQAARWLLGAMGKLGLRDWLCRRRGKGLDARALRFWELVLDIPHREVNAWLREQAGLSWTERVRR